MSALLNMAAKPANMSCVWKALDDHIVGFWTLSPVARVKLLDARLMTLPAIRHFILQVQLSRMYKGDISISDPNKHRIVHSGKTLKPLLTNTPSQSMFKIILIDV